MTACARDDLHILIDRSGSALLRALEGCLMYLDFYFFVVVFFGGRGDIHFDTSLNIFDTFKHKSCESNIPFILANSITYYFLGETS